MADIGDIVVTAHSDDADDDDGMVPASGATASGATASGATTSGATASGGASPPDAFEDPVEGVHRIDWGVHGELKRILGDIFNS